MSHLSCCLPSTTRVAPWRATPAHLVRSALRAWIEWRGRTVADRDLQSLDAYMLRDIGLSHRAAAGTARRRTPTRAGPSHALLERPAITAAITVVATLSAVALTAAAPPATDPADKAVSVG